MGIVSKDEFNDLFERLEVVRQNHYSASGLTSTQQTALGTAYNTTVAVKGEKPVPNNVQELKDDLNNLSNSPYIAATFSSNITIPSIGDLLKASNFSLMEEQVSAVEALCANCTYFSSNFTSASQRGNFSSDYSSNFSSNFTSASQRGNFSSDYSSNFSSNFSSDYSSNFSSNFSSNYSTNFSSNFSSNYSTNFSSNFGSNFGSNKGNFSNFTSAGNRGNFSSVLMTKCSKLPDYWTKYFRYFLSIRRINE